mgnify:FL=1
MTEENLQDYIKDLIDYMDNNVHVDGPYKCTVLKTVATYYEALTQAEGINAILMKSFNSIQ